MTMMAKFQLGKPWQMNAQDYREIYWPQISKAVDQMLSVQPGEPLQLSFEETYSCIYSTVCKGFGHQLYIDLIEAKVDPFLAEKDELLKVVQTNNKKEYLELFDSVIVSYLLSIQSLTSVFIYLAKTEDELADSSLHDVLVERLNIVLVNNHIPTVLNFLIEFCSKPFAVEPATSASIIKNLYRLRKDVAHDYQELFSRFLPECIPRTKRSQLEDYINEAKEMSSSLASCTRNAAESRKRALDDDNANFNCMDDS